MALGFDDVVLLEIFKYSIPALGNKGKKIKEDFEHFRKHKFLTYLQKNYVALNISTSQLFRNIGYEIDDLYVPLTIMSSKNYEETMISHYPEKLLRKENKIIINDSAGMGKSTILKMLYRFSINEGKAIPFYVDLKSLINGEKVTPVQDFILKKFPQFTNIPSDEFWYRILDSSKFIFLFDGADEVPDTMKAKVFDEVRDFCAKASHCNFVVATRNEDIILSSFYDFSSYRIKPLKEEEAYLLLRKYQFKDVNAEELIQEINKTENSPVKEFLTNPLLTTLLYTAYAFKRKIPLKKNLFFSQIYNALYENHDATKIGHLTREKKSGLDIDQFEIILSHLAYRSRANETLEYTHKELTELLGDISKKHPTIDFSVRGFIEDMVSRVPILRKDGFIFYWQHKSIQEYFFVRFLFTVLDDTQRKKAIKSIATSKNASKYRLILDILFDENEELFHDIVTVNILDIANNNWLDENKSNEVNSINVFYRYITGPYSELAKKATKEENRRFIKKGSGNNKHKALQDIVERLYDINGFYQPISRISFSKSTYLSIRYQRPQTIGLEILHAKKIDFVSLVTTNTEWKMPSAVELDSLPLIHNMCNPYKLEHIEHLRHPMFIIDKNKGNEFYKEYNKTKKERDSFLEEFDF
jgi:hypothetical protein